MRPLPEPMDGEAARPPRSTDNTARIPVMDDDAIGRHEAAGAWPGVVGPDSTWRRTDQRDPIEAAGAPGYIGPSGPAQPGWYDRARADVATPHYPRHQAAKDDLPGPTRRELARLVRQVRALVIVLLVLFVGLHAYALYGLIIG